MIKQLYGNSIAIGGDIKDIIPLHTSVWNWHGTDNELINMGGDFNYFIVDENKYLKARAIAFSMNWPYSYKGTKGGCWPFAMIKAKKELNSFPYERFIPYTDIESTDTYSFGRIPKDLSSLNEEWAYDFSKLDKDKEINLSNINDLPDS